ncbi:hypothetical protein [Neptunicoccus cionae]|uniref:hypothetical protein n=1 Tax=Neptunicoccus cionae TaxID=2035344 RepID=UPI003F4AE41C
MMTPDRSFTCLAIRKDLPENVYFLGCNKGGCLHIERLEMITLEVLIKGRAACIKLVQKDGVRRLALYADVKLFAAVFFGQRLGSLAVHQGYEVSHFIGSDSECDAHGDHGLDPLCFGWTTVVDFARLFR